MKDFKLTNKQLSVNKLLADTDPDILFHLLLEGGSRSAKTFLHLRNMVMRAQKAPFSRQVVFRNTFKACKQAVVLETLPKMMRLAYPGILYHTDKTDWYTTFKNGSEIWYGGLDDKERLEKILGKEYCGALMNECSEISNDARQMVLTRIAQVVMQKFNDGTEKILPLRIYYDCNPPLKSHWCFKIFHKKIDPETRKAIANPDNYAFVKMNPNDNKENLSPAYIQSLKDMNPRYKKRFYYGEYGDENPNQLFNSVTIDTHRVTNGNLPDFLRIVIPVDPSGSDDIDNLDNDEIGIMAIGLGTDGKAYLLEDLTVKAGPGTWGNIATSAYDRHEADCVIGETNYGGAMVKFVIQTSRPNTPYKEVHASRGKHVRAEPIAALYEKGQVCHVGYYPDLEDELEGFSTMGYLGAKSPNRADALIWGISELFPGLVNKEEPEDEPEYDMNYGAGEFA